MSTGLTDRTLGPAEVHVDLTGLHRSWTRAIDQTITRIIEPVAAAFLAFDVLILLAGVFSRYVLRHALTWSDEAAIGLYLWSSMLGVVAAYQRRDHMRLTAFFRHAAPEVVRAFDVAGHVVVAIFSIALIPPSIRFFLQEMTDTSPALNLPRSVMFAPILVGLVLLAVVALLRLTDAHRKTVLQVGGAALAILALAYLGRGALVPLGNLNLVIFFVLFVGGAIAAGIPIAFAFGIGTIGYLGLTTSVPLDAVVNRMDEGISHVVLLAIPLFVLLGLLIENAGIAQYLVGFLASLVGHIRGGLGVALVFAMYLVSGISGAKAADMAAVAPVLFPEMERRGTPRPELVALLASSGAMAETIPPSLILIIIGSVTGVSIAALFTAGLLPAAVAAIALLVVVLLRSRQDRVDAAQRFNVRTVAMAFVVALPGLALPLVIRTAVLEGVATATEVSTIGIVYTILIGVFVYRRFDWRRLYPILRDTNRLNGSVILILATATAMSWSLTQSGFAKSLAAAIATAPGGSWGFLAISIAVFAGLGSFLEGIPAIVLFGPLLFPIAHALGINEVHYAIVAILAMGIGLFSPPLGIGFYAACAIGKCEPDAVVPRIFPYLAAILVATIVVAAVPWLSTGFLPPAR